MSSVTQRRQRSDGQRVQQARDEEASVTDSRLFRLGRVLFGGILAYTALDNLRNLDERIQYAKSKGAPFPERSVPAISASLLVGSVGVALWRLPSLASAAIAWFFVSVTPVMHDFWNEEAPEQKQQQRNHFLKNTALLGAALAFMKLGRRE